MLQENIKMGVRIVGIQEGDASFGELGTITLILNNEIDGASQFRVKWDHGLNASNQRYIRQWRGFCEVDKFDLASPEDAARAKDMKQRLEFAMRYL